MMMEFCYCIALDVSERELMAILQTFLCHGEVASKEFLLMTSPALKK